MAEAVTITQTRGDTWAGLLVEILLNGEPLDLTGATTLCQFRRSHTAPEIAKELTVTVTNGAAGLLTIEPTTFEMPPRTYVGDLQLTLSSGRVLTPISFSLVLTPDVSRP